MRPARALGGEPGYTLHNTLVGKADNRKGGPRLVVHHSPRSSSAEARMTDDSKESVPVPEARTCGERGSSPAAESGNPVGGSPAGVVTGRVLDFRFSPPEMRSKADAGPYTA